VTVTTHHGTNRHGHYCVYVRVPDGYVMLDDKAKDCRPQLVKLEGVRTAASNRKRGEYDNSVRRLTYHRRTPEGVGGDLYFKTTSGLTD
jgi:hypothetical protein